MIDAQAPDLLVLDPLMPGQGGPASKFPITCATVQMLVGARCRLQRHFTNLTHSALPGRDFDFWGMRWLCRVESRSQRGR